MRGLLASAAVVLMVGSVPPPARAQPGNPRAGRQLALQDCAVCHIVAAKQETKPLVPGYGPSFFEIANKTGTSLESLEDFLIHGHPRSNMPAAPLTPTQVRDVAGYILTLRGQH